jgi:hypothetical protein
MGEGSVTAPIIPHVLAAGLTETQVLVIVVFAICFAPVLNLEWFEDVFGFIACCFTAKGRQRIREWWRTR